MNFDVRTYRRRLQRWREVYAGVSQSIRVLKAQIANGGPNAPALQRTLVVMTGVANELLVERENMKDYWHMNHSPRYAEVVMGVVLFT